MLAVGKRNWRLWAGTIVVLAIAMLLVVPPSGAYTIRDFDPVRTADLELRMWQAYYAKENVRLFGLLVVLLREQYHYSWASALLQGSRLARAAARFGNAKSDYERSLPELTDAYAAARRRFDAHFDPAAVAKAELAWWVARRVPGRNAPEQVGELIAEEYALLYEVPIAAVREAAVLRARAGALRDSQATQPDWQTIGRLLDESYRKLSTAVRSVPSSSVRRTTYNRCQNVAAVGRRLGPGARSGAHRRTGGARRTHLPADPWRHNPHLARSRLALHAARQRSTTAADRPLSAVL